MTTKRFALAWVASTVAFLVLHVLLHGVILGGFFRAELGEPKAEPSVLVLGMLILLYPALMTYVYQLAYKGAHRWSKVCRLGAIAGLFFVLPLNLVHTVNYRGCSTNSE